MVDDKGDIPELGEVKPGSRHRLKALEEIVRTGEATVHLTDGGSEELHAYDTYFFESKNGESMVYTQDEDENDVWIFVNEVTRIVRH